MISVQGARAAALCVSLERTLAARQTLIQELERVTMGQTMGRPTQALHLLIERVLMDQATLIADLEALTPPVRPLMGHAQRPRHAAS